MILRANIQTVVLVITVIASVNSVKNNQKAKVVTTLIDAKWEATPVVLEIAEYIGEESIDDYWSFIDDISNLKPDLVELDNDKLQYEKALEIARRYLSVLQLKALKLALSLHIFSPKIEMFGQMASERGLPESRCPAAIDFDGRLFCHAEEFVKYYKTIDKQIIKIDTYKVDHHYPGSENRSHVVVLYGELGTSEFSEMHHILRNYAQKGAVNYVLRHYVKERPNKRVRLSGYGVELQMKSTEYKVMDDTQVKLEESASNAEIDDPDEEIEGLNFFKLKTLYPDKKEELDKFRSHLLETSNEMAPLKVWQVQELSLQAAERILASSSGEEALRTLTHIAHNFPLQARSLIRTKVRPELKTEILKNQDLFGATLNLAPSDAAIFVNGMYFDMEIMDVISLLEVLRQELRIMEKLHKIGIAEEEMKKLIALDLSTTSLEYAIDIRDSAVQWINDIEYDKQYRKWSDSLLDLLRPTFPGMLRSIRRNLYNLVLIVDPSKKESKTLLKLAESFYVHTAPLRLGIVFAVPDDNTKTGLDDAAVAALNAFNYVSEVKDAYGGLSFITDVYASVKEDEDVTPNDIHRKFKEKFSGVDIVDIFGEDTIYDTGRKLSVEFIQRSGFRKVPQALLNGIPLSDKLLNGEDFEDAVLTEIMNQTPQLQKAVFKGEFSDTDNAIDYLMGRPNVMPRLNERVLSENAVYLDLTGIPSKDLSVSKFQNLSPRDKTATLLHEMKYFTRKIGNFPKPDLITHWVVTDLDVPKGRNLLRFALEQMKSSASIRVGVIVNPSDTEVTPLTELILTALDVLDSDVATSYISKILENEQVFEALDGFQRPPNFNLPGFDVNVLTSALVEGKQKQMIKIHRAFVKSVLKFQPGELGVVTNGRIFGPFEPDESFVVDDFSLLDRFSYNNYGEKILQIFKRDKSNSVLEEDQEERMDLTSDTLMQTVSILVSRSDMRNRFKIPIKQTEEVLSAVSLPPEDPSLPAFDIVAIVDPVSRGAQKIGPILSILHQAINSHVRVFLNCVEKNSDLPLKSFYKYVLEPELQFQSDGRLSPGPIAKFSNLPTSVLLTQAMHVPENWLVESVRSPYDLDNIKLDDILENTVHSEFELEYLLLEGHCFEATLGNPPRGLQITLGTETNPTMYDTIVMANLGYFQLKANPGAWILRLREGRSSEIYNIISHEGSDTPHNSSDIKVIISSFRSHVLKLKVQKKPDKLKMDLLADDNDPGSGIWNSITSSFSSKTEEEADDVINIFSLASGHLYERFIKIMMLSVLKHTKTPVKFWFLKNYLSPTLKDFLPHMAKEYGFEYELVQYKWPRWLHQQTEKQRIIWGYKILFLDVLFPLHVKKIIFVDADQVVRADMKELRDLDLGGAPYGYTPFCNSRKEMDGFRFWNQGYWKNHLQGRRYHISALYVVDLKRFRRIAAGDRLRGQYQALSQDPNSLSNLDQDLPNNMIHQVAIKSLPQEWLWCETWCDDASKQYAKTIDLCNNPLTKEAKLTAAMRIVSEWKDYDNEIKELQRKIDATAHAEEVTTNKPLKTDVHTEL